MKNLAQKLASFQNFLVIAAADGALNEAEKQELVEYGSEMGLQPDVLKPLVNAETLDFRLHENKEDNLADLGDMLTIAAADGVIFQSEFDACKRFAKAAGISEGELNELLEFALKQSEEDVSLLFE